MADWSVYFVRTREGALYCGIATDVDRRFEEHLAGSGAKFLRGRGPLELIFRREIGDRGEALRIEYALKQLSKAEKERLADQDASIAELRALLGEGG